MIRKNLLNCKLNLPFFVEDPCLEGFRTSVKPGRERCPFCGARGRSRIYASYERNIIDIKDGKPFPRRIRILRLLCGCGHTHALLPDFIVPYNQYTLPFILHVLRLYFSHSMTVRRLQDEFWVSPSSLYSWKSVFARHREWWPEFVRFRQEGPARVIDLLLSRPVFSDFASGFWRTTLYSFLQTHANPANCRHLPPGW